MKTCIPGICNTGNLNISRLSYIIKNYNYLFENIFLNVDLNLLFRYGRKIWLTEFAKARTNNNDVVLEYMDNYLSRLEESDIIYRYANIVR